MGHAWTELLRPRIKRESKTDHRGSQQAPAIGAQIIRVPGDGVLKPVLSEPPPCQVDGEQGPPSLALT